MRGGERGGGWRRGEEEQCFDFCPPAVRKGALRYAPNKRGMRPLDVTYYLRIYHRDVVVRSLVAIRTKRIQEFGKKATNICFSPTGGGIPRAESKKKRHYRYSILLRRSNE